METELEYWKRKLKELRVDEPHYPQQRQRIKAIISKIEQDQKQNDE